MLRYPNGRVVELANFSIGLQCADSFVLYLLTVLLSAVPGFQRNAGSDTPVPVLDNDGDGFDASQGDCDDDDPK